MMRQPLTTRRHKLSSPRGNSLLLTLILLSVLTVVALGVAKRTSGQTDAVAAKRNYDVGINCAEGARQMLFSKFRTFGATPSQLTLDATVGDKRLVSGHYDTFTVGSVNTVTSVVVATGSQANSVGLSDIANRATRSRLGGTIYRMTVVCTDTTGQSRQSEIEFLVRFGL